MIYSSSDPTLFTRFSIPQTSTWALIALKDHDSDTPSSVHRDSSGSTGALSTWLLTHRLPTTLELTQDTFQSARGAARRHRGRVGAEQRRRSGAVYGPCGEVEGTDQGDRVDGRR